MGFVGNYAPWGLSPQTDGMPVIPEKPVEPKFYGYLTFGHNVILR